ncbi:SHOCT domain-containing protein [Bacillus cereus group sp. MYBK40-2]|nr:MULTISPECIES: SHOCT domain-containing protein [Bacillus]MDA1848168.1 SHOCT domain-containing protein [Bacillus cereus]MDA1851004.1 SHOCT domain-containing protein [Bacillus cereus]MDA2508916.1 SHOCT domain-containing protein [Bacillus cereus]MEC3855069.1 SHOCT domain-containing protein [Bacillus sp. WOD8 KX774193]RXG08625.1 SHOCT domain-containing protein [Bacillus cereus]
MIDPFFLQGNATISVADELKKFKELLDMGGITEDEFNAKKKQLLNI